MCWFPVDTGGKAVTVQQCCFKAKPLFQIDALTNCTLYYELVFDLTLFYIVLQNG